MKQDMFLEDVTIDIAKRVQKNEQELDRLIILVIGLNLPPINHHFHWCRSAVGYIYDIQERGKGSITKITDKVIENIKDLSLKEYTNEENNKIGQIIKNVLKYSRDENNGKEVGFIYNDNFELLAREKGSDTGLSYNYPLKRQKHNFCA